MVLFALAGVLFLGGCSTNDVISAMKSELAQSTTTHVSDTEETATPGMVEEVESVSGGNYAYECLDDESKKVYDEVLSCMLEQKEKVSVATESTEVLDGVYQSVLADYGEIFWVSGYVYTIYTQGDSTVGLEFAPKYTMTREERDAMQLQIDQEVDEILLGISEDASDYEKAKYVFEYLTTNVDYQVGSDENQNIISVFINHVTVCQGYSCATQYLLKKLGIPCVIVTGEANNDAHAWNLILLDGAYYFLDTTWGNSSYQGEDAEKAKYINYNYFCVTTEELMLTHTPNELFPLPDCVATSDNYYIREGIYFDSWQPDTVGNLLKESYVNDKSSISIKFATDELYDMMKQYFIEDQHIAEYCEGISTVYYIEDTKQNVFTVNFY